MPTRRRFVAGSMAGLALALAGCIGDDDDDSNGDSGLGLGNDEPGGDDDGTDTEPPLVNFDFDYDPDDRELITTFANGDEFDAGAVSVEGTGIGASGESWADIEGLDTDEQVGAGDRLTLSNVATDFELDLVWEDGDRSTIIGSTTGPDT